MREKITIASYNIEWMNGLFDNGKLTLDQSPSAREGKTRKAQALAIAHVLKAIDADIVIILEAPNDTKSASTKKQLEEFAEYFELRTDHALHGYYSTTDQEIALLYDPALFEAKHAPMSAKNAPKFISSYYADFDEKAHEYQFSKPPLEAKLRYLPRDFDFRILGTHLKTKAPHGAQNPVDAVKIGFHNRYKQIAQAEWISKRVQSIREPLILGGDLNDDVDYDAYEDIIGKSPVDMFLEDAGLIGDENLQSAPPTARFWDRVNEAYKEARIDYLLVNDGFAQYEKQWKTWNPLYSPVLNDNPILHEALLTASDHFPITLEITFEGQ